MKKSPLIKIIMSIFIFLLILCGSCFGIYSAYSRYENTKSQRAAEGFIDLLKENNFEKLKEQYPILISFEDSKEATPEARSADIRARQRAKFDSASKEYKFTEIKKFKIEDTESIPLQYELSTDSTIWGKLIYNDGSTRPVIITLNTQKVRTIQIDGKCLFNEDCPKK